METLGSNWTDLTSTLDFRRRCCNCNAAGVGESIVAISVVSDNDNVDEEGIRSFLIINAGKSIVAISIAIIISDGNNNGEAIDEEGQFSMADE